MAVPVVVGLAGVADLLDTGPDQLLEPYGDVLLCTTPKTGKAGQRRSFRSTVSIARGLAAHVYSGKDRESRPDGDRPAHDWQWKHSLHAAVAPGHPHTSPLHALHLHATPFGV